MMLGRFLLIQKHQLIEGQMSTTPLQRIAMKLLVFVEKLFGTSADLLINMC